MGLGWDWVGIGVGWVVLGSLPRKYPPLVVVILDTAFGHCIFCRVAFQDRQGNGRVDPRLHDLAANGRACHSVYTLDKRNYYGTYVLCTLE